MMNADPPEWTHNPFENRLTNEAPFRLRPGWDVLIETEAAFRERAEKALASYIRNQRNLAAAKGFAETKEKRQPLHFDWLALHQVKRYSFRQIDDWNQAENGEDTLDVDVIRKGILSAANLCGLKKRPIPRGRPPKNRK